MTNRELVEALRDCPADAEVVLGVAQDVGIKGAFYSPGRGLVCLQVEERSEQPPDEEPEGE